MFPKPYYAENIERVVRFLEECQDRADPIIGILSDVQGAGKSTAVRLACQQHRALHVQYHAQELPELVDKAVRGDAALLARWEREEQGRVCLVQDILSPIVAGWVADCRRRVAGRFASPETARSARGIHAVLHVDEVQVLLPPRPTVAGQRMATPYLFQAFCNALNIAINTIEGGGGVVAVVLTGTNCYAYQVLRGGAELKREEITLANSGFPVQYVHATLEHHFGRSIDASVAKPYIDLCACNKRAAEDFIRYFRYLLKQDPGADITSLLESAYSAARDRFFARLTSQLGHAVTAHALAWLSSLPHSRDKDGTLCAPVGGIPEEVRPFAAAGGISVKRHAIGGLCGMLIEEPRGLFLQWLTLCSTTVPPTRSVSESCGPRQA